jgi:hypothetical protein
MLAACAALLTALPAFAADPCVSGTPVGQRPGPYSFLIATGPQRGQSTCYICETGDKPAVVVFARTLGDPLGKLMAECDGLVTVHKAADLRGWMTLLGDGPGVDKDLVAWGKKHAIRQMPLGVFDDTVGPPTYKLAKDADVTVILFVKQRVVANFAFRAGELTDDAVKDVARAIPLLVEKK